MPAPLLEEVFKTGGVPTYTFVEPKEYADLILNLRTPGRGLVIEGPSGIGKTTAVEKALARLGLDKSVTKLSARRRQDVEYIESLPELGSVGVVIVDDFHKLPTATRSALADYMKTLADEEAAGIKIIVIGINKAGQNLISFAHDLVNRIDIVPFESNSDEKVRELIDQGCEALNAVLAVENDIVVASQGSFYIAQMLSREVCKRAGILERCDTPCTTGISFESVKADVWERLALVFRPRCERFCRGTKMKREGRAPYLHILRWLAEGSEWTLSLRDAIRSHPAMRGSVGQVVDKGYLRELMDGDEEIAAVMHLDSTAEQLTVEDPQFIYFIRNIPWRQFAYEVGFMAVDFPHRYDFALSFAGEDRGIAEALFNQLVEYQVEVFYDRNEQHRILASDAEEYLKPIYQSEARFVVVLLSAHYPRKVWTKFESEHFKSRFRSDAIIPVWFADAPPGIFDTSRTLGGFTIDCAKDVPAQLTELVQTLVRKLREDRGVLV
ncbi:TIR domain-containing protein [Microcystis elabens FACHB-917]|nr:TIR domain-containing protein [Microcystis elabens FACHB-917]